MYPSYPVFFFIAYLLLFLLVPVVWELGGAWLRARGPRTVTCPEGGSTETVTCDRLYAIRRHAAGERTELRIVTCTRWPELQHCDRHCL